MRYKPLWLPVVLSGTGKALSIRFAEDGARVVVADRAEERARQIADQIQGLAVACDVAIEADIQEPGSSYRRILARLIFFCSNAEICLGEPDSAASAGNAEWQACWEVHVMAHV
jgi:NAD(P)-dependent dehydrogenase (short-subunit alcohol dehydrogenase family)